MGTIDRIIEQANKLKDAAVILAALVPAFEPIVMMIIGALAHFWPQKAAEWTPDKVAAEIAKERLQIAADDEERNKRRTEENENGDDGQD